MLQHAQRAVRSQDALDLFKATSRVTHTAEDETAQYRVKRRGPERKRLSRADDERNSRRAAPCPSQRVEREIQGDGRGVLRQQGQVPSRAGAKVEDSAASAGDQRTPPFPDADPLVQRADDVVDPWDLLDTAHYLTVTSAIMRRIMCFGSCFPARARSGRAMAEIAPSTPSTAMARLESNTRGNPTPPPAWGTRRPGTTKGPAWTLFRDNARPTAWRLRTGGRVGVPVRGKGSRGAGIARLP
jgi:hypothetical protein